MGMNQAGRSPHAKVADGTGTAAPLEDLAAGSIDPHAIALFLDFDGTLVGFADHPEQVFLLAETRAALTLLSGALGGALAVVTGRDIGVVDGFLAPLRLPVAGVHGLKRRSADGALHEAVVDGQVLGALHDRLARLVEISPGLLLERKSASVALHYRARPELEGRCIAAMDEAVAGLAGLHLMRGKMVIEAKADGSDKGGAVEEFLAEQPFAGRRPFFAGDDVTDEDAFAAVNARGGVSIKVGPGPTAARYRAADIADFLAWLQGLAETVKGASQIDQS